MCKVIYVIIYFVIMSFRCYMSRLTERIENFNRAFNIYEKAVKANITAPDNELFQMSVVQSFEICFELSWKVLKDFLAQNGINVYLPRDVIKTAFVNEVIKNGQVWIDMMNARNATSHEYNSDKIKQIIKNISTIYYEELYSFKEGLKNINE